MKESSKNKLLNSLKNAANIVRHTEKGEKRSFNLSGIKKSIADAFNAFQVNISKLLDNHDSSEGNTKEDGNEKSSGEATKKDDEKSDTTTSEKDVLTLLDARNAEHPDGEAVLRILKDDLRIIFNIMGKRAYHNVLIVGESGTGRHHLVDGISYAIKTEKCPDAFKESLVLAVPAEQFSTNFNSPELIIERINTMYEIAKSYPKTIFYLDEFEKFIGYGVLDAMKIVFDNAICICVIDTYTEEKLDVDLKKICGLTPIDFQSPKREDIYPLIKGSIENIEENHGVKINKKSFKYILDEALLQTYEARISDVLDITDEAASIARNMRGTTEKVINLDIRDVLETNRSNINEMMSRPKEVNRFYAIHEAGHAVVAINYGITVETATIIPQEAGTGGFNLFTYPTNSMDTLEDTLHSIETALGGYVATKYRNYPQTYGAANDLKQVSKIARAMSLYLGLEKENPISYLNDEGQLDMVYMSESMKKELADKVAQRIAECVDRATEVIKENEERFNLIAEALEKKGFLTKEELISLYVGTIKLEDLPSINDLIYHYENK